MILAGSSWKNKYWVTWESAQWEWNATILTMNVLIKYLYVTYNKKPTNINEVGCLIWTNYLMIGGRRGDQCPTVIVWD